MILRHFILLVSLLMSVFTLAKNQYHSRDISPKSISQDSYKAWNQQFDAYLLNHPDPYVQVIGLGRSRPELPKINGLNKDSKLNDEQQNYVNHINQLAQSNTLSSETIHLLLSLCSNYAIRDSCHRKMLLNKHKQQYPYDLSVYLEPLAIAMNHNDASMAEYMIKNIRDAKYTTDMTVLPTLLKSTVKTYMDEHPVPRSVLLEQLELFTDISAATSDKTLNKAYYYILLSGIRMSLPIPNYRNLIDYCSSNSNDTSHCVDISDTLIHKTKNSISQLIGYKLKVKTYENSLLTDELIRAEAAETSFRAHYKCIADALSKNQKAGDYLDPNYSKLWFTSDNEIQRIKSVAQYLYKKGQSEGYTDILNPENCGLNQEQISNSSQ